MIHSSGRDEMKPVGENTESNGSTEIEKIEYRINSVRKRINFIWKKKGGKWEELLEQRTEA